VAPVRTALARSSGQTDRRTPALELAFAERRGSSCLMEPAGSTKSAIPVVFTGCVPEVYESSLKGHGYPQIRGLAAWVDARSDQRCNRCGGTIADSLAGET